MTKTGGDAVSDEQERERLVKAVLDALGRIDAARKEVDAAIAARKAASAALRDYDARQPRGGEEG